MNSLLERIKALFPADCHDRIFLTGGSVRDLLQGTSGEDIDLAAALPERELRRCGFHPVTGKTTAPIWFRCAEPLGKVEITRLEDSASLEADLRRRDFTINAMAMRLSGELLDPLSGRADLSAGYLQACSDQAFLDDPLRIFRALRFETAGWRMTAGTEQLIRREDWPGRLGAIPVERFSRELLKALAGKEPERFLQRMRELDVGRHWLPELFRMDSVPAGPLKYHPEGDLFTHAVQTLQRAALESPDPLVRFCAFFHDLGKLATDPALYPKHHGHEESGARLAVTFCNRLALPAGYRKALAATSRLHPHLYYWDELRHSTRIKVAEQSVKGGIAGFLPIVARADKPGSTIPAGWSLALEVATMTTAQLGIDAGQLAAMTKEHRPAFIMQKRVEKLRQG